MGFKHVVRDLISDFYIDDVVVMFKDFPSIRKHQLKSFMRNTLSNDAFK